MLTKEEIQKKLKEKGGTALEDYNEFMNNCEDIDLVRFCKYFNVGQHNIQGLQRYGDDGVCILYTEITTKDGETYYGLFTHNLMIPNWEEYLKTDPIYIRKLRNQKLEKLNEITL